MQDLANPPAKGLGQGSGKDLAKGFGKGKNLGEGKGEGKLKGQELLALEDQKEKEEAAPKPEAEELQEALKMARKAAASTRSDLEEALKKAKPSLSRQGQAAAAGLDAELGKVLQQPKEAQSG